MPALQVNIGDPIFIGDFFGLVLALPIALFLAYWLSAVKNHMAVVVGALVGVLIGFLTILAWVGTLIFDTPLPNVNGAVVFFASVLFCSICGLVGAILTDLLIARQRKQDYSRQNQLAHE